MEDIIIGREQQLNYCNQDYIGLPFSKMLMNIVENVTSVKGVVLSRTKMSYPYKAC